MSRFRVPGPGGDIFEEGWSAGLVPDTLPCFTIRRTGPDCHPVPGRFAPPSPEEEVVT